MRCLMMMAAALVLTACGSEEHYVYLEAEPCYTEAVAGGVNIICPDSETFLPDGVDGTDGTDGVDGTDGADAVVEIVDPCGDDPGEFDEVLLRLSTGDLLAYFEDSGGKRFLSLIGPGNYMTTDKQSCPFTVNPDMTVTW